MDLYLVPANTKKSTLIMGFLRGIDAIILGVGTAITVLALLILGGNSNTWLTLLACVPMSITVVLVLPIPNYHNTLVGLQSILRYYNERRKYIWKGWCICNEFKDNK